MNQQCFASNILFKTFLIFTLSGITAVVNAATYYINNSNPPGVQCNNNGSGTTVTTPWCDIYKVNNVNFEPGDVINLARGSTWIITTPNNSATESGKGMIFDESDNGSAAGNVTIQAYGNPLLNPPHITTVTTTLPKPESEQVPYRGIVLNNAAYWVIKDLEISHVAVGIFFYYTERNFQNISLSGLKLHHIYGYEKYDPLNYENIEFSSGILFRSVNTLEQNIGDDPIIKNVSIDTVEGYHNQSTINFSLGKRCIDTDPPECTGGTDKANAANNVVLNHLHIYDNDADKQSAGCYESVRLGRMNKVVLMNSIIERAGGCQTASGTTAVILGYTSNVKIINNIIRNTAFTKSPDESAIDMEVANGAVQIHGNLFAGNQMGTECMAIYPREWCKFTITSNSYMLNRKAAMFINGDEHQAAPNETKHLSVGDFKYNLHYALPGSYLKRQLPDQTSTTHDLFSEVTTTDTDGHETNVKLLNATDFYSAAADFGDADVSDLKNWSYEWFDGNSWHPMIYNTQYQAWHRASNTAPYITSSEMRPASGAAAVRVWTAPKAGTISIVGRIAKSATLNHLGNGVYGGIYKNYDLIWPSGGSDPETLAYADMVGKNTNVFNLSVQANDKIRFGVAAINGDDLGDIISWAPMIAYTAVPEGVPGASIVWEFNTPGWLEFWGKSEAPSDAYQMTVIPPYDAANGNMEGALRLDVEGTNPYIRSRLTLVENDAIDGAIYRYVTIKLKHNSNASKAKLSWIISGDLNTWTDPASGVGRVKEIDLQTTNEYQELTIDMGDIPEWTNNKIWQLRLDPIDNPTNLTSTVYLDYIRLDQIAP